MTYRIEYYLGSLAASANAEDHSWHKMPLDYGVDASDLAACLGHADFLDDEQEGRITHRVVEVEPEVVDQWDARGLKFIKVESYRRVKVAS
jgi:hypothetical protein